MKYFLLLLTILSLASCSSLYTSTPKTLVYKTAQYESGNKQDGVINMYFTYDKNREDVKVNVSQSEENACQICKNWGYSGAKLQVAEGYLAKCIQFNFRTGNCLRYKANIKAFCY